MMRHRNTLRLRLIGGVVVGGLLAGCSDDSGPTGKVPDPGRAVYVGAAICEGCHKEIYEEWNQTLHAQALATLQALGQDKNDRCLACHTVGFGARSRQDQLIGYISQEQTPHLANVQCENCHGPGSQHAAEPSEENIVKSFNADVCAQCHTGFHHPTADDWAQSGHADSLESLLSRPYASEECLECHAADRRLAVNALPGLPPRSREAGEVTAPVSCVTCHNPHARTGNAIRPEEGRDFQLREPEDQLCVQCHTAEEPLPDDTPHHPQGEMLAGTGGFAADGSPATGPNSRHTEVVEKTCVQCHVHRLEVEDPTIDNPVVTGHTFQPTLEACTESGCHADVAAAAAFKEAAQTRISTRLAAAARYFDPNDPLHLPPPDTVADRDRYNVARFNYRFVQADGSRGVHNTAYANELLTIAETILIELSGNAGTLEGTVRDADTGNALVGASVSLAGGPSTTTDSQGEYRFVNLVAGSYSVTASQGGYESQTVPVTVPAGGTVTQDFPLSPSAQPVSFANDVQPLLTQGQCTLCHNGALESSSGGLNLEGEGAYAELVNVPSETDPQQRLRVEPSNSADSYLYVRITATPPHPFDGALSVEEVQTIQTWIDQGAPDN